MELSALWTKLHYLLLSFLLSAFAARTPVPNRKLPVHADLPLHAWLKVIWKAALATAALSEVQLEQAAAVTFSKVCQEILGSPGSFFLGKDEKDSVQVVAFLWQIQSWLICSIVFCFSLIFWTCSKSNPWNSRPVISSVTFFQLRAGIC